MMSYDKAKGTLHPKESYSLIPPKAPRVFDRQAAAAILITDDGMHLYATNRATPQHYGENSIVCFKVLEEGRLKAF